MVFKMNISSSNRCPIIIFLSQFAYFNKAFVQIINRFFLQVSPGMESVSNRIFDES